MLMLLWFSYVLLVNGTYTAQPPCNGPFPISSATTTVTVVPVPIVTIASNSSPAGICSGKSSVETTFTAVATNAIGSIRYTAEFLVGGNRTQCTPGRCPELRTLVVVEGLQN